MICCRDCKFFDPIDDDMGYCFNIGSYLGKEERRVTVFNCDVCDKYIGEI
jgi:hypothetical protein